MTDHPTDPTPEEPKVEQMTDLETFIAMLDRAGIEHEDTPAGERVDVTPPGGSTSVRTGGDYDMALNQPHRGGYVGFFQEHIFDASGALWAIWGWEP